MIHISSSSQSIPESDIRDDEGPLFSLYVINLETVDLWRGLLLHGPPQMQCNFVKSALCPRKPGTRRLKSQLPSHRQARSKMPCMKSVTIKCLESMEEALLELSKYQMSKAEAKARFAKFLSLWHRVQKSLCLQNLSNGKGRTWAHQRPPGSFLREN